MSGSPQVTCVPVTGFGEIRPGDDLAALIRANADLCDGDVVVVTSKVVSKAEGRVVAGDRAPAVIAETDRVVARRGGTTIVRTRHGLVMAAAGVDASNTPAGTVVLLPVDPDESARELRRRFATDPGVNVGVVVSDTSGRAWRAGQTDIAVGAAGLVVLDDHAGRTDPHGNLLAVTAPALADEIAAAGDLVKGKVTGCPVAVVRGLGHLVLEPGADGPGASALVRPESDDLFGLGAREAVTLALAEDPEARRGFGSAAPAEEVEAAVRRLLSIVAADADVSVESRTGPPGPAVTVAVDCGSGRRAGAVEARLAALAFGHGWAVDRRHIDRDTDVRLSLRPATP